MKKLTAIMRSVNTMIKPSDRNARNIFAITATVFVLCVLLYFLFRFAFEGTIKRETFTIAYGLIVILLASLLALKLGRRRAFVPIYIYGTYLLLRFILMENYQGIPLISLFQYFVPLTFFFLGFYLWSVGTFNLILKVFLFATAISLLIGQANYYLGFAARIFEKYPSDLTMVGGELVQRGNSLAGYSLGTGILAALGIIISLTRPFWQRMVLIPGFLIAMLNAYSRGAWIMVITGIAIWSILPYKSTHRQRWARPVSILSICVLIVIIVLFLLQSSSSMYSNTYVNRFVSDLLNIEEEGNYLRLTSWQWAATVWQQNPLFGVGFGTLGSTVGLSTGTHLAPESMYLKILGELGIVGFVLYCTCTLAPMIRAIKYFKRTQLCDIKNAGALIASVGAILFGGVYLQNVESDFFGLLLWLFIGGLVSFNERLPINRAQYSRSTIELKSLIRMQYAGRSE